MSNFIFNAAATALNAATLDLSSGNYYAHLVTTTPLPTNNTVANLVVPTASGYAPTVLTGLSDNSQRWTFDSFTFPRYIFAAAPPVGVVICKRAGASPATGDQIICYSDFLNSIEQVIVAPVGAYLIGLTFGAGGAINKAYRYQYSSGAYVPGADGGFPKGLIYLIGSSNNTVTFANPSPSKVVGLNDQINGASNNGMMDRSGLGSLYFVDQAIDFGAYSVRLGGFGYKIGNVATNAITQIFGSNYLPSWNPSTIQNNANWTQLATISGAVNQSSSNDWVVANTTDTTYWRYLRWSASVQMYLQQIELYNSSILSPTQNLA